MQTSSFASLPTLRDAPAGPLLRAFCMRAPDINTFATFAAWPVDTRRCPPGTACWSSLSSFETLSRTRYDLLQVIEPHRPFCFVDHPLVLSVFLLPRLAFRRRCFPTAWTAMRGLCLGLRLFFAYSRSLCSQARWRFSLTCSRWFDALLWS